MTIATCQDGGAVGDALPIPVEVPGLETVIPNIEDGGLVLLEGGPDPAKSFMARRLARSAIAGGRRVRFLTSREAASVRIDDAEIEESAQWDDLLSVDVQCDLFVDSFSFLAIESEDDSLVRLLREWRRQAGDQHAVVLTLEHGMMTARQETIAQHMADAVLEFRRREREDSVRPYLQIPRWFGGRTDPRNYYLSFTGDEMMVDTRTRLV